MAATGADAKANASYIRAVAEAEKRHANALAESVSIQRQDNDDARADLMASGAILTGDCGNGRAHGVVFAGGHGHR